MGAAGCDQSRGGLRWWQVSAADTRDRDRDRETSGSIILSYLWIKINNEQPDIFLCMVCHCVNDISVMTFRNCSYFTLFDYRNTQEKIIHDYRKYVNCSCNYFNIHFGLTYIKIKQNSCLNLFVLYLLATTLMRYIFSVCLWLLYK